MNAEEKEYMDYLIHNRTELTIQIIRHLDEIELLQKKLDIATKALDFYKKDVCGEPYVSRVAPHNFYIFFIDEIGGGNDDLGRT